MGEMCAACASLPGILPIACMLVAPQTLISLHITHLGSNQGVVITACSPDIQAFMPELPRTYKAYLKDIHLYCTEKYLLASSNESGEFSLTVVQDFRPHIVGLRTRFALASSDPSGSAKL